MWGWLLLLAACGDREGGSGGVAGSPDPFDENVLATYRLTMDPADWDRIVADPHSNVWRRCAVEWQGEVYADVAVHASGERSRIPGNPKPSLRLKFDEFVPGREFHDYGGLKLDAVIHDGSMMRARLQYPAYAARGVPAPRYAHGRLYVNGDYKGLYGVEERITREFLRKRLGPPVDQLYAWTEVFDDMLWVGEDLWRYVPVMWEPRIEDLPPGAEGVRELVRVLNQDPAAAPAVLDVEAFIEFMAAEVAAGEGDGYVAGEDGSGTENMFLCRVPSTGRYMLLPWDRDQGFWRQDPSITFGFSGRVLTRKYILEVPANLERYRRSLLELVQGYFEPAALHARIEAILAQVRDAAFEDPYKRYTNEEFLKAVDHLKRYVTARSQALRSQL